MWVYILFCLGVQDIFLSYVNNKSFQVTFLIFSFMLKSYLVWWWSWIVLNWLYYYPVIILLECSFTSLRMLFCLGVIPYKVFKQYFFIFFWHFRVVLLCVYSPLSLASLISTVFQNQKGENLLSLISNSRLSHKRNKLAWIHINCCWYCHRL